jgi:hypothetical protein
MILFLTPAPFKAGKFQHKTQASAKALTRQEEHRAKYGTASSFRYALFSMHTQGDFLPV